MFHKKAVAAILVAFAASSVGAQANSSRMIQRSAIGIRGVGIAAKSVPAPIAIAPTSFAQRAADLANDGLSGLIPGADPYNVAFANARPQSSIEAPADVVSDEAIRLTAAAVAGPYYYGRVYDSLSGRPLAGATITLGQVPNARVCNATLSCGRPAGRLYRATTNVAGSFGIALVPAGQYMLTLTKSSAYATLHMQINVHSGHTNLGLRLLALSPSEQAWLSNVNYARLLGAFPRSASVAIDQYAEVQARNWALLATLGRIAYADASFAPYVQSYARQPGAMYGASGVEDLQPGINLFQAADAAWMAEKANCPRGNWQICRWGESTGHYINLVNTQDVWVGVGETTLSEGPLQQWPGYSAYDIMTIMNTASPGPA